MIKILEITECSDCPHFDNEYYGYEETCTKLHRKIERDPETYHYMIPEDCPLETKDDNPS